MLCLGGRYLLNQWYRLKKIKEFGLFIGLGAIFIVWTLTGANPQFEKQLEAWRPSSEVVPSTELVPPETTPRVTGLELMYRTNLADRLQEGSQGHIIVVKTRILVSVMWGLVTLLGLLLSRRSKWKIVDNDLTFLIIAIVAATSPVWLLPLTAYGGEVLLRAYLPFLIPLAFFSSKIIDIKWGAFLITFILIAAAPLNLIAHYGNEVEYPTPSEVTGNDFFYNVTNGGRVLGGIQLLQYKSYGKYEPHEVYIKPSQGYDKGLNTQYERIAYMKQKWIEIAFGDNMEGLPIYVRLTHGDKAREAEFMNMPEWFDEREDSLSSSQMYNWVYINPDFKLYLRQGDEHE